MKIIKLSWQHSVRMMLAAVAIFLSLHAHAAQGYAVLSKDKKTLTFKYGTPTGTEGVNYFNTDNTNFSLGYDKTIWGHTMSNSSYSPNFLITKVVFESSFANARPRSCAFWFYGMTDLTTITGLQYLNTSQVTDMRYMFYNCSSLTSFDLSKFDTRNVTNMRYMFMSVNLSNANFSSFNTSKVTDMSWMFCSSTFNPNILKYLNTANVTTMKGMFYCFYPTTANITFPTNFNTGKVTDMSYMFYGYQKNQYATPRKLRTLDLRNFNTANVVNMDSMFRYSHDVTSIDVSTWNTSKVKYMENMFNECNDLQTLDVSKWDTGQVTITFSMFGGCEKLKKLDVSNWNMSNCIEMAAMFALCRSLTTLDVSKWNTSKVKTMVGVFRGCYNVKSIDVSKWNTSNVEQMRSMFYNCNSLTSLDLRSFDTRKVKYFSDFIKGSKLQKIVFGRYFDVGSRNTYDTNPMIVDCPSLRYVDFYLSDDTDAINSSNVAGIFEETPATTVVYLPHGSQEVKDRTNFVYSYNGNQSDLRCPMYYSVDKVDIEFPCQFRTNEALYDRTATMGSKVYGSATLPFEFKSNSDIQAYSLNEQNQNMTELKMVNVQTVAEHTPFAFKRLGKAQFVMKSTNFGITVYPTRSTNASEKTWTVAGGAPEETAGTPYDGTTGLSNWKTKGYYVKETKTDYDGMYFIQDNYFKRAVGPLNLVDHRALFYPTGAAGAASVFALSFVEEDMATAIEAAETEQTLSEATEIYDASGCRLEEARKGLNIIRMSDGTVKKVFIK